MWLSPQQALVTWRGRVWTSLIPSIGVLWLLVPQKDSGQLHQRDFIGRNRTPHWSQGPSEKADMERAHKFMSQARILLPSAGLSAPPWVCASLSPIRIQLPVFLASLGLCFPLARNSGETLNDSPSNTACNGEEVIFPHKRIKMLFFPKKRAGDAECLYHPCWPTSTC